MAVSVDGGQLRVFSQDEFHAVDHLVTGITFDVHNEFGRFFNEILYTREIARKCVERGIQSEREVKIRVEHNSFSKAFFVDLLLCRGVIFEVKAVEALTPSHECQTLTYLLLTGIQHGKLINLRPDRVQKRFISTKLTLDLRKRMTLCDADWRNVNAESRWLKQTMVELLFDWGAFLECGLYREAIIHFLGGPENVNRTVEIYSEGQFLGEQKMDLLTNDTAFVLTGATSSTNELRNHLQRFLRHTRLRHLQWINLNHHHIEFTTISN